MTSDGPSFNYAPPEKDKTDEAIRSAAKEHVWEHRKPVANAPLLNEAQVAEHLLARQAVLTYSQKSVRTFTREEVLLSLRAILASRGGLAEAIVAFERIE